MCDRSRTASARRCWKRVRKDRVHCCLALLDPAIKGIELLLCMHFCLSSSRFSFWHRHSPNPHNSSALPRHSQRVLLASPWLYLRQYSYQHPRRPPATGGNMRACHANHQLLWLVSKMVMKTTRMTREDVMSTNKQGTDKIYWVCVVPGSRRPAAVEFI